MNKKSSKSALGRIIEQYRPHLIPIIAFGVLVIIVLVLAVQVTGMSIAVSRLVDYSGKSKENIDAVVQTLLIETKYTNELRSQFGLSQIEFPIETLLDKKNSSNADSSRNLSFFRAIDRLSSSQDDEKNTASFKAIIDNPAFESFVGSNALIKNQSSKYAMTLTKNDIEYFTIGFNTDSKTISIVPFMGEKIEKDKIDSKTLDELSGLAKNIDSHSALVSSALLSLLKIGKDQGVIDSLKEKELTLSSMELSRASYTYAALKNKSAVFHFGLDKKTLEFFIDDKKYRMYDEFSKKLIQSISEADTRDETQKVIDSYGEEIKSVLSDKAFKTLLEIKKLTMSTIPRDDYYFIYYDVTDASGKKAGSFAIDKFHPNIYLMDKDDVQISSLTALVDPGSEEVKKN
jgi:hypothetical protein